MRSKRDSYARKTDWEKPDFNATSSIMMESQHKMIGEPDAERQRMEKEMDDHKRRTITSVDIPLLK